MARSHRVGRGLLILAACGLAVAARAQDWGTFSTPTPAPTEIFGTYNRGCLQGAEALPLDGAGYQVMRLSRGRYYGHPSLVHFVETLASEVRGEGYPGLLVGDMAQPRGGPMPSGHASHQIGLDVDIWFLPAPGHPLTDGERERLSAPSMVADGGFGVTADWGPAQIAALHDAATMPEVARIFVNPAIKKELCQTVTDRAWLAKIRPWWGHDAHFHVRLACPPGADGCVGQAPVAADDGCNSSLDWWFTAAARAELEKNKAAPVKRLTLYDLPPGCLAVFAGG